MMPTLSVVEHTPTICVTKGSEHGKKPDDSKDKVIKQYRYMYNSDTVQKFWSPLASAVKHKSDTSYSSYTVL